MRSINPNDLLLTELSDWVQLKQNVNSFYSAPCT